MLRAPCSLSTQVTEPPLGAAVKSDGNGALRICSRVNFFVGAAKETAHAREKMMKFRRAIRLCYTLKRQSATDPTVVYAPMVVYRPVLPSRDRKGAVQIIMLSYSKGPDTALADETISEAFRRTAAKFPDREALVSRHQNVRLTWAQLDERVEETARGLAGLGLRAADRVGVWSTNCVEWILVHLACARIGAVLVNVNPAYRAYELQFVLRKSRMNALFLCDEDSRSDYASILREAQCGETLALKHVIYFGSDSWELMLGDGVDVGPVDVAPADVTNIQYTSGTTGFPKGVLLTHRNVLNNAMVISQGMHISEQDRICVPVPLYHCFGGVAGTLLTLVTGATMILPAAAFA